MFIPFATGGGIAARAAVKAADHADDAADSVRWLDEAVEAACSFTPETLVATPDGMVPISSIEVGDIVLAWDAATERVVKRTVTAVLPHPDNEIARVTIDGAVLTTTPDHPFYTIESGWVEAGRLWRGTHVQSLGGSATVSSVERQQFIGGVDL